MSEHYINYDKLSEIDKLKKTEELKLIFLKELNEDNKYKDFFKNYNPDSVTEFKNKWSKQKANLIVRGEMYKGLNLQSKSEFVEYARRMIWDIQQYKLLEYEALWRAKKIINTDILVTHEFNFFWAKNIKACPFVSPITESEFNEYIEFVKSDYCTEFPISDNTLGIGYEDVKQYIAYLEYSKDKNYKVSTDEFYYDEYSIGEYCMYMFNKKGIPDFMYLPDLKGEKQQHYNSIKYENDHKERDEAAKNAPPPQPMKETLSFYNKDLVKQFISNCEDSKLVEYNIAYNTFYDKNDDDDLFMASQGLQDADEMVEIEANDNWSEAIKIAFFKYKKRKVLSVLSYVYEEMQLIKNNYKLDSENENSDLIDMIKKRILAGRRLAGEPENFDY